MPQDKRHVVDPNQSLVESSWEVLGCADAHQLGWCPEPDESRVLESSLRQQRTDIKFQRVMGVRSLPIAYRTIWIGS